MSVNLLQHFSQQYASSVALLLAQTVSKFRGAVMEGSHTGEQASPVDQVGPVEMSQVNSRFEPKTRTDAAVDRRWLSPTDWDIQQMIDTFDKLKMVADHKGAYVQNTVRSINRRIDRTIIAAFTAAAQTGKTGTTSTTILAGNTIGVNVGGTASNVNVAKVKAGLALLLGHEVDEDETVYMALNAANNTALLNEIQVIGREFGSLGAVISGDRVTKLLGVNFIHSQLLVTGTDDQSGTSTSVPMWVKSGMHLGMWQNQIMEVRQAKEFKGNPWEVYAYQSLGATRIEEKKVVRIWAR